MELLKELLVKILEKEETHIVFPNLKISASDLVEMECYKALRKIKSVIENDSLEDKQCFMQIEEIINIFESSGSNGGGRHDF